ncbi:MAG: hypothetical protein NW223_13685 [Hyphomicrobiaceae bacterium]|nr:hypothetical protein [Hyphomicrobiaceae bacterium]
MHPLNAAFPNALPVAERERLAARMRDWLAYLLVTAPARLIVKRAVRKAEQHLLTLDAHILRDIGIDGSEVASALGDRADELRRGQALLGPVYGSFGPFR